MSRLTEVLDTRLAESENYFVEGKFQASELGRDLVKFLSLITIQETDEIFSWCNGFYVGGSVGENRVRATLRYLLGSKLMKVPQREVSELMSQVRLWSYQPYSIFESDMDCLPLANGVLDIKAMTLDHYRNLHHFFNFQIPVAYDPGADCPAFKQFVSEVVYPADVPLVQEIFGYCLWREGLASIKKAIMFLGAGDNGKSLLLTVLVELLGRLNVTAMTLVSLAENRFASANLRGKLANINPDLPDAALKQTGQFKGLTGDDVIPYEIKHGGSGEFVNRAKLIFSTNKLPDAQDDTDGYYTRWVIVNFPYQFVRGKTVLSEYERPAKDKNMLKAALTGPKELSGILNWSLEGLKRLKANGCFTNELSSDKMRDIYVKLANSLKAFLLDRCVVTGKPDDFISKDEFYRNYIVYCQDRKLAAFTKEKVGRKLPDCSPGQLMSGRDFVKGDRMTSWRGIRFVTEDESDRQDQQTLEDDDSGSKEVN